MYLQISKQPNNKIMFVPKYIALSFMIYGINDYFHHYSTKSWLIVSTLLLSLGILEMIIYEYKDGLILIKILFSLTVVRISCKNISKITYIDGKYGYGAHINIQYFDGSIKSIVVSRGGYETLIKYFEEHCGVKVKIKVPD